MKQMILAGFAAAGLGFLADKADAAAFTGYVGTGDVFFDDAATFDYDPFFLGGLIADPGFLVDISLASDLSAGSLTLFDDFFATVLDGALLDTMLSVDNGVGDDSFSMLFSLTTVATPFAVATFTGDIDGSGTTDFFTDGVLFTDGNLTVTGAAVVPLPAGILLLGTGLAGLCLVRKRRTANGLDVGHSGGIAEANPFRLHSQLNGIVARNRRWTQ